MFRKFISLEPVTLRIQKGRHHRSDDNGTRITLNLTGVPGLSAINLYALTIPEQIITWTIVVANGTGNSAALFR